MVIIQAKDLVKKLNKELKYTNDTGPVKIRRLCYLAKIGQALGNIFTRNCT